MGRGGCEDVNSVGVGWEGVGSGEDIVRIFIFPRSHPVGLGVVLSVMTIRGMSSPAFCLAEWSGLRRVKISSWYSPRRRERGWSGLLRREKRRESVNNVVHHTLEMALIHPS